MRQLVVTTVMVMAVMVTVVVMLGLCLCSVLVSGAAGNGNLRVDHERVICIQRRRRMPPLSRAAHYCGLRVGVLGVGAVSCSHPLHQLRLEQVSLLRQVCQVLCALAYVFLKGNIFFFPEIDRFRERARVS
jgi:hypothetical protein